MIDIIKRFFSQLPAAGNTSDPPAVEHDIRVAVCALFLEMGHIDESFTESEMDAVLSILMEKYELDKGAANALMAAAAEELKASVDLWQFADLINKNYSTEEKVEIIEILWRIIYVDGKLDQYEDYLVHKLQGLLRLTHKQLIDAKLKVLHGDGTLCPADVWNGTEGTAAVASLGYLQVGIVGRGT